MGKKDQCVHEDGQKTVRTIFGRFHITINHLGERLGLFNVAIHVTDDAIDTVCSLQVSSHCQ